MAVIISWDDSIGRQAIHLRPDGAWRWDDFRRHFMALSAMLDSVRHRVAVIMDLGRCVDLPTGAADMLWQLIAAAPQNLGRVIVVARTEEVALTFAALRGFDRQIASRVTVVGGLEAARKLAAGTVSAA